MRPRVDYNDEFAPNVHLDTIRVLIDIETQKGWNLFQLDVKSTSLDKVLQDYVEQPECFVRKWN